MEWEAGWPLPLFWTLRRWDKSPCQGLNHDSSVVQPISQSL
jgi:hypothetical protein